MIVGMVKAAGSVRFLSRSCLRGRSFSEIEGAPSGI